MTWKTICCCCGFNKPSIFTKDTGCTSLTEQGAVELVATVSFAVFTFPSLR
jgi:hypothetical protein